VVGIAGNSGGVVRLGGVTGSVLSGVTSGDVSEGGGTYTEENVGIGTSGIPQCEGVGASVAITETADGSVTAAVAASAANTFILFSCC
jgi:hypothetical protein